MKQSGFEGKAENVGLSVGEMHFEMHLLVRWKSAGNVMQVQADFLSRILLKELASSLT